MPIRSDQPEAGLCFGVSSSLPQHCHPLGDWNEHGELQPKCCEYDTHSCSTHSLAQPQSLTPDEDLQQTLIAAIDTEMEVEQEAEDKKHKKYEERKEDTEAALAAIFALLEEVEYVGNGKTRGKRLREADFS